MCAYGAFTKNFLDCNFNKNVLEILAKNIHAEFLFLRECLIKKLHKNNLALFSASE